MVSGHINYINLLSGHHNESRKGAELSTIHIVNLSAYGIYGLIIAVDFILPFLRTFTSVYISVFVIFLLHLPFFCCVRHIKKNKESELNPS